MEKIIRLNIILLLLLFISNIIAQNKSENNIDFINKQVKEMTIRSWNLREKNPDSAIIIALKAKEIAEKYNFSEDLAKINGYLGVVYFHYKYDMRSAIPYLQESLRRSMLVSDSTRLAYSYNNLGDVYLMSGNIPLALNYSEESIRIFKHLDNKKGIAYGYINMGLINQEEKRYDQAYNYFTKALIIRKEIGDSTGYASALYQLARTQQYQGKLDSALANYFKSYNHHLKINNISYTASCLNGIATIYFMRGDYKKSLQNYLKAIELHGSKNHYFGLLEDYLGIAMVYAELGMKEEGKESLDKALEISNKLKIHPKVLETYKTYAKFYQTINNKDAALEALNKFIVLYDSVLFLQQIEVLEEVTSNYRTQQSLQLAKQELESQSTERKYLIIIILLMIIIGLVFIWRDRLQQKINRKLKEANNTKDKLFSVLSHDLRSPFNTIVGFSDLIRKNVSKDDKETVLYSELVYQKSIETLRLVDNLLTWTRAQSNKIVFNPKLVSLDDIFERLKSTFKYLETNNKVSLEFVNNVDGEIKIDTDIITIVLTNLISNSLKFTPTGGKIKVNTFIKKNKLIFKVIDSGIGMDNNTLNMLRNNKNIVSANGIRNEGGTGLGLSICRDLLVLHHGNMDIESVEGNGTEITISLLYQR